jgi:UDPglucose 6-dehydrogenase
MQKITTSIIGVGTVGGALLSVLPSFIYDKYKNLGSVDEINQGDVIFICVPTPFDTQKSFVLDYVEEAISYLKTPKIIVIRSSIKPGSTYLLQKKYPDHKILYCPEFLTEKHANEDIRKPSRNIIGYTEQSLSSASIVLSLLPRASFERIIPALEAELVKYGSNAFLATKVIYSNQLYDLCDVLNANYDLVKEGIGLDSRIGPSHMNVFEDGSRGYSGKCLPKDTRTLIQVGDEAGANLEFFKKVEEINRKLVKDSPKDYE